MVDTTVFLARTCVVQCAHSVKETVTEKANQPTLPVYIQWSRTVNAAYRNDLKMQWFDTTGGKKL